MAGGTNMRLRLRKPSSGAAGKYGQEVPEAMKRRAGGPATKRTNSLPAPISLSGERPFRKKALTLR